MNGTVLSRNRTHFLSSSTPEGWSQGEATHMVTQHTTSWRGASEEEDRFSTFVTTLVQPTRGSDEEVAPLILALNRNSDRIKVSPQPPAAMKHRLHFVVDPIGWLCISMVFGIWLYNTFFIPKLVLLPHYNEGHIPWATVVCYYMSSALCLAALFRASTADPGRLPVDPHIPHSEREHWELCNKCNLMRPKRSHHCSRCGHCVRRMDHHCPWINNCVGEDNHWLFLQLCFYAQVLSLFTLVLDFCQYYYFQPLTGLDQEKFTTRHELALLRGSAVMGMVMFGGMTSLFYTQMTGILSDTTTIEKMAQFSSEIYGSRRSWQWALAEVCGTRWKLLWLLPLRVRQPLQASHLFRTHV